MVWLAAPYAVRDRCAGIGFVLTLGLITLFFSSQGAIAAFGSPLEMAAGWALQAVYYLGLGFLGGWYGGYLRRRQSALSAEQRGRASDVVERAFALGMTVGTPLAILGARHHEHP